MIELVDHGVRGWEVLRGLRPERDAPSAVERQFELVGEARSQLSKVDLELASKVSARRGIISFRNILIHGYARIDSRLVWNTMTTKLPGLIAEVDALLEDAER
jgi:uncharacterized protein with HEPN domain